MFACSNGAIVAFRAPSPEVRVQSSVTASVGYFRDRIQDPDPIITFKNQRVYAQSVKAESPDFSPGIQTRVANQLVDRILVLLERQDLRPLLTQSITLTQSYREAAMYYVNRILDQPLPPDQLLNLGVRGAAAILTNGITTTSTEGISQVEIVRQGDQTHVRLEFAAPIRAAGGTTIGLIIGIAQAIRLRLGVGPYIPEREEIERYTVEVDLYNKLKPTQILPSIPQIRFVAESCTICIDGVPTEPEQVPIHKYLRRVKTPRIRGGVALSFIEGLIMKSRKLIPLYQQLGVDWPWLKTLVQIGLDTRGGSSKEMGLSKFELTMGRPLLSLTQTPGGLRYRVAKGANNGLSAALVHPLLFDLIGFINIGTQVITKGKMPKAATLHASQDMGRPLVEYGGGLDYYRKGTRDQVVSIIDQGEIGYSLGQCIQFNYPLPPRDYCVQVWRGQSGRTQRPPDHQILSLVLPGLKLHPDYSLFLRHVSPQEYLALRSQVIKGMIPDRQGYRQTMRKLGAVCTWDGVEITPLHPQTFRHHFLVDLEVSGLGLVDQGVLETVNKVLRANSRTPIGEKGLFYVDLRVGRAESVAYTRLKPPVNGIAEYRGDKKGGFWDNLSSTPGVYHKALYRYCKTCDLDTYHPLCRVCLGRTVICAWCDQCKVRYVEPPQARYGVPPEPRSCDQGHKLRYTQIRYKDYQDQLARMGEQGYPGLRGPLPKIKLFKTRYSLPYFEPFPKIYLRALHGLPVSRDGTIRLNMMNLCTTQFTPDQVRAPIPRLRSMGYQTDAQGQPLTRGDQTLNLKPSDIIMPLNSVGTILEEARFLDQLLTHYYRREPYYSAQTAQDLIGCTFTTMAPHISCAYNCRIVGWANVNGFYSHPVMVAARRRNLDGDQDYGDFSMGIYLNFSRAYASDRPGSLMGSPLMVSDYLRLTRVDDQAHQIECMKTLPPYFYDNTRTYTQAQIQSHIRTYKALGDDLTQTYVHRTPGARLQLDSTANLYKDLGDSRIKFEQVLRLQSKLRIRNQQYQIGILEGHLLRDLIGNSNAYFKQNFRCNSCDWKYRFPPLRRQCVACGAGQIQTTVSPGMVTKYVKYVKVLMENQIPQSLRDKVNMTLDSIACFLPLETRLEKFFRRGDS